MELTRRKFLLLSAAGIPGGLLTFGPARLLASGSGDAAGPTPPLGPPWHQRVRRVGQVNFNERDPVELNVEAWADYWASLKVDAVLVSVTGILAFYPTKVPFHRRSKFLGGGDLFGACAAAAKKRGLRVIARLSPDLQWEDALAPHPEWFMRDEAGGFIAHGEEPHLYKTCSFSTYFTEHIPAIMREVQASYDVDGLFTNAWPPLDGLPVCHCDVCRKLAKPKSVEYWGQYSDRTVELWRLYDSIAKEKKPDNLFLANMGAGISAAPNLMRVAEVCQWFNADNQGRGGDATPIWGASQQGRVASAVMKGRTVTNVTGAYATGGGLPAGATRQNPPRRPRCGWTRRWRAAWRVWYHWVGGQGGLGEDHRWQGGRPQVHGMACTPGGPLHADPRHRECRRLDGPELAPLIQAPGRGRKWGNSSPASTARSSRAASSSTLRMRTTSVRGRWKILGAPPPEHRVALRLPVRPAARLRRCRRRLAHGLIRDRDVYDVDGNEARQARARRPLRDRVGRGGRGPERKRVLCAHRAPPRDP